MLTTPRLRLLTLLLLVLVSAFLFYRFQKLRDHHTHTQADVLLEQYVDVLKLVTNEGHFQEIYAFKDYWGYDVSFLRKQALIRAKGKVAVGYNLEEADFSFREKDRMVILEHLPKPAILYLEVEMDYYDVESGTFNPFKAEDLNRIEKDVKEKIRQKALQSDLFRKAETQANTFYNTLRIMASQAGWEIRYRDNLHLYALP